MKISPFTPGLLFAVLAIPIAGAEDETPPENRPPAVEVAPAEEEADPLPVIDHLLDPEPSVAVLPTEVSLNGIDQPALGRSLSDSLIGGLLAQDVKVISYPGEKGSGRGRGRCRGST